MKRLNGAGAWLSVFCSILTILAVVWKGGVLANTIDQDEKRIQSLEANGSQNAQSYITKDEQRTKDTEARIVKLEKLIEGMSEMKADIREIKTEIKNLRKP